ncbi:MAG TPA: hypothetical protein VHE34_17505 [Puia sp.]|nr:hypothetical protein [Puia sp.]HVU97033.1 hypothetical protein [Puia sp.]
MFTIYNKEEDKYQEAGASVVYKADDILCAATVPGFSVEIKDFFNH